MKKLGIATGVALGCGLLVSTAGAQDVTRLEKIEVTGSSIKRIDAETALPVQILRREDIERIGATTTEELLKQVTAITSAGSILAAQANGTITTSQSRSVQQLGRNDHAAAR